MRPRHVYLAVAACAVAVYLGALSNGYALDDIPIIATNPLAHRWSTLWRAFAEPYWPPSAGATMYRPLAIASYVLDWHIGGARVSVEAPRGLLAGRRTLVTTPLDARFALGALCMLGWLALVVWAWRRGRRVEAFGLCWIGIALMPVAKRRFVSRSRRRAQVVEGNGTRGRARRSP